jgi:serine/threonine protein kinase
MSIAENWIAGLLSVDKLPIKSSRYELVGMAGRGDWGTVYVCKDKEFPAEQSIGIFSDPSKALVAIKVIDPQPLAREQMLKRGIDLETAIKKEAMELANCRNIVPRRFERDENGQGYIVMPYIRTFLSGFMREIRGGIPTEQGLGYIIDIAAGLAEMHTDLHRIHADLKAENIALKDNHALLNDLGNSTVYSSTSPRERMGWPQVRAPEVYAPNGRPTERSDVWGAASLSYKILTGNYILEAELDHGMTPEQLFSDPTRYRKLIKRKLKQVPRQVRKVLARSLELEPLKRQYNGEQLHFELQEAVNSMDAGYAMKRYVKRVAAIALPAAAIVGLIGLNRAMPDGPSPAMLAPPSIVYTASSLTEKPLEYKREDMVLPMYQREIGNAATRGFDVFLQQTNDREVAYLTAQFEQASCRVKKHCYAFPNSMTERFEANATPKERESISGYEPVFYNIRAGLAQARRSDGKVDLEDALAIAYVGPEKVLEAKIVSGSNDFKQYIGAVDGNNEAIISAEDRTFITAWLSYVR